MNITEEQTKLLVREYIGFGYCPSSQPEARSKDFFSSGIVYELWQHLQLLPLTLSWIPRKEELTNPSTNKATSVRYVVFNLLRKAEEIADENGRAILTSIDVASAFKVIEKELLATRHHGEHLP